MLRRLWKRPVCAIVGHDWNHENTTFRMRYPDGTVKRVRRCWRCWKVEELD